MVQGNESESIENVPGAGQQDLHRQVRIPGRSATDRARHFGQDELTGDDVGARKKGSEGFTLRLVPDELDEG